MADVTSWSDRPAVTAGYRETPVDVPPHLTYRRPVRCIEAVTVVLLFVVWVVALILGGGA